MRRLFLVATTVAILLALFAPAALAASASATSASFQTPTRNVLVAVEGTIDVPSGEHLDGLVVVNGDARIRGDVDSILVVDGSAVLEGATTRSIWVVDGTAQLGAGTTVTGSIHTLRGTVTQAPGSDVQGEIRSVDGDFAAFALAMIPLAILFMLGLGLLAIVAAVVVATLAARQTRELEALISDEPGPVLVAGILGAIVLPVLSILLMVTVIGAPIGLAILFLVMPVVLFLAWIVAAIWLGDWLVTRMRGEREAYRPVLAAVLGVIVLSFLGILPFVSAIATVFGLGALLLAAWRTARGDRIGSPASGTAPMPTVA